MLPRGQGGPRPMSRDLQAVFFDVDGVLIDSLEDHLQFSHEKALEFGLKIAIPDVDGFRRMALEGKKVNPMPDFFRAVGFPENTIEQAFMDYKNDFSKSRSLRLFDGAGPMLQMLQKAGAKLGLVTANIKENVEPTLGELMYLFEPSCLFFLKKGETKATQIVAGAHSLNIATAKCVFVGDMPADETAARESGSRFVGVTYGWGFRVGEHYSFEIADKPSAIPLAVQRVARSA